MQNKYNSKRAVQFMPFDALKGLKKALREKEVQKVSKIILSEDDLARLQITFTMVKLLEMVEIVYYHNYHYYKIMGVVSKIDLDYGIITIIDQEIKFEDIYDLTIMEE